MSASAPRPFLSDSHPNNYGGDYTRLHPKAKATDFFDGKLLPQEQIIAIQKALATFKENARYSKLYLKSLGINIDRGGVIRVYNQDIKKYELFATYKILEENKQSKSIKLGQGFFGKVKLIQNLETGEFSVLKIAHSDIEAAYFKHESEIITKLGIGFPYVISKKYADGQIGNARVAIIQKFFPGKNLLNLLQEDNLTLRERLHLGLLAIKTLWTLHKAGVAHHDIKLDNLIYDVKTDHMVLVDFGLSKIIDSPATKYVNQDLLQLLNVIQQLITIPNASSTAKQIIMDVNNLTFDFKEQLLPEKVNQLALLYSSMREVFQKYFSGPDLSVEEVLIKNYRAINSKIKPDLSLEDISIDTISAFAEDKSSQFLQTSEGTKKVKNIALIYAAWLIHNAIENEINMDKVQDLLEKLFVKLETLPHFGLISRFKKALTPEASLLKNTCNEIGNCLLSNKNISISKKS